MNGVVDGGVVIFGMVSDVDAFELLTFFLCVCASKNRHMIARKIAETSRNEDG